MTSSRNSSAPSRDNCRMPIECEKAGRSSHARHLCQRMRRGAPLDEIRPLARDGKFICAGCGRVANDASLLCEPENL